MHGTRQANESRTSLVRNACARTSHSPLPVLPTIPTCSPLCTLKLTRSRAAANSSLYLIVTSLNSTSPLVGQPGGGARRGGGSERSGRDTRIDRGGEADREMSDESKESEASSDSERSWRQTLQTPRTQLEALNPCVCGPIRLSQSSVERVSCTRQRSFLSVVIRSLFVRN
jgi:hypothetical protein